MTICKPCLEKLSKDSNKIYQLFKRLHTIATSENTLEYKVSVSKDGTYLGVPLQQIWIL